MEEMTENELVAVHAWLTSILIILHSVGRLGGSVFLRLLELALPDTRRVSETRPIHNHIALFLWAMFLRHVVQTVQFQVTLRRYMDRRQVDCAVWWL